MPRCALVPTFQQALKVVLGLPGPQRETVLDPSYGEIARWGVGDDLEALGQNDGLDVGK